MVSCQHYDCHYVGVSGRLRVILKLTPKHSCGTSPHSRSGRAHALESLSLIAAHNRCEFGFLAALPAYPCPRLTLTSGMSQFGPASGSHLETRGHIMTAACKCGLSALLLHWNHSSKLNQRQLPASVARSHAVLALARGYSLTDRIAPGDTARFRVRV